VNAQSCNGMGELFDASPDTLFTVLRSYLDESGLGKNVQEVLCCIAGFQCRNSLCIPFQDQWGKTLAEYGIDEFKSKQFWTVAQDGALTGKYSGWSFGKANLFISDLVRLIRGHRCHLLAAVVNLRDFFSYDEDSRRYLTGASFHIKKQRFTSSGKPNSAYFTALTAVIGKGVERASKDRQLCHFIFDEQNEYESLAKSRVSEMRGHFAGSPLALFLGDVGYSPSHRVLALQAADLAAHVCKEYYRRKMLGIPIEIDTTRGLLTPLEIFSHLIDDNDKEFSLFKLEKKEMDAILHLDDAPVDVPEIKL
jgi:hypothetical protein